MGALHPVLGHGQILASGRSSVSRSRTLRPCHQRQQPQDSNSQPSAIAEMPAAGPQMDEMTQHDAALAVQAYAAIENTEVQAVELDKIVDIFRIDTRRRDRIEETVRELQTQLRTAVADRTN